MIYILGQLSLALGILRWLTWEYEKPFRPRVQYGWLVLSVCFCIAGLLLSQLSATGYGIGNVLLHAVGGGMATAATFEYLVCGVKLRLNWRISLAALVSFVSVFGVFNEFYEFAADIAGLGQFSIDRFDTWKDFVANTSGALLVWLTVRAINTIRRKR